MEARGPGRVMRIGGGRGAVSVTSAMRWEVSAWMCNGEMKERLYSSLLAFALVNLVRQGGSRKCGMGGSAIQSTR